MVNPALATTQPCGWHLPRCEQHARNTRCNAQAGNISALQRSTPFQYPSFLQFNYNTSKKKSKLHGRLTFANEIINYFATKNLVLTFGTNFNILTNGVV